MLSFHPNTGFACYVVCLPEQAARQPGSAFSNPSLYGGSSFFFAAIQWPPTAPSSCHLRGLQKPQALTRRSVSFSSSPSAGRSGGSQPLRASSTPHAREPPRTTRQGRTFLTMRTTRKSREKKTRSRSKRMKQVCTEQHGIKTIARPSVSSLRPINPLKRFIAVSANSTLSTSMIPLESFIAKFREHGLSFITT